MKKALAAILIALPVVSFPALGVETPDYDINAYCKEVTKTMSGGYSITKMCLDAEERSKQKLANKDVAPEILKYCKDMVEMIDGSYSILDMCITSEEKSKADLDKRKK